MPQQKIRLGHSPDPDDAFMFFGLANGAVDSGDFQFEHILRDIQTLNDWAGNGKLEVTAISVHAYPYVCDKYAILSSGASFGATDLTEYLPEPDNPTDLNHFNPAPNPPCSSRAQGPLLIAREPMNLEELASKTIAVPGTLTSAFLALKLILGEFDYLVMMFDEIPHAVKTGRVDAGLIIHEGQLTYKQDNLHCLIDLGCWWHDQTQLPLPLGCNVIRRDLGPDTMARVSKILKASILYSLEHRSEAVKYALQFGRGLDEKLADEFVGMYVNHWTIDYGPRGRQAVCELLKKAHLAGFIPDYQSPDFV
ncbi:MAG: hypothetical protein JXD22_11475 [Sedimentisphaerales bacterium]|nr:hypothetical protein [Sedimentisphaerales bacterium]